MEAKNLHEKTALKIGLACALGAMIGTVISLKINDHFWWVGTIVGVITGYLSYEFPKIMQAVPTAWQKAKEMSLKPRGLKNGEDKRVARLLLGVIGICLLNVLAISSFQVYFFGGPHIPNTNNMVEYNGLVRTLLLTLASLWIFVEITSIALILVFTAVLLQIFFISGVEVNKNIDFMNGYKNIIKYGNFIVFPIWVTYHTIRLFVSLIYTCARLIWHFFKNLLLLIHSEARLICGLDAGIGSVIGYLYGSPIIGALFGAIFGIANYYIVSIKILKLKPKF